MAITELSKLKANIFDPFRQCMVAATPEELVRQKVLQVMITQLGFPKELLAVEKQLSQLPHLQEIASLPNRRIDILCFAKGIHPTYPLYPLLLVECKEGDQDAEPQVLGYNSFIKAPFVAIARENEVHLLYPEKLPFLPPYSQLMEQVALCK